MRNINKKIVIFFLLLICFAWVRHVKPVYLSPDGVGYYSYLPSLFIDNNMDFENEFRSFKIVYPLATTPTGYICNIWPIGTAFFLTPFFLIALVLRHLFLNWIVMNPKVWLILFANLGSSFYGCAAGWVSYYGLRSIGLSSALSLFSILLAFVGTPLFYYTFGLPNSAHAVSAFTVAIFLLYWIRSRDKNSDDIKRWFILGILLGLGTMVRIEECLYAVAPLIEISISLIKKPEKIKHYISNGLLFGMGFILGVSPELISLRVLYGSIIPPQSFIVSLKNFALFELLFSPFHGVMLWTPILLIALAGFFISDKFPVIRRILLITVFLQILTASCGIMWWYGNSFGIRILSSCLFPVAIGIGFLLQETQKFNRTVFAVVASILTMAALWTFSLSIQAMIGWINLSKIIGSYREIWNWQEQSFAALKTAVPMLFGKSNMAYFESMLLFIIFCLFLWIVYKLGTAFKDRVSPKWIILTLILILSFDFKLIRAGLNKPSAQMQNRKAEKFITQDELQKIFQTQAIKARRRYDFLRSK